MKTRFCLDVNHMQKVLVFDMHVQCRTEPRLQKMRLLGVDLGKYKRGSIVFILDGFDLIQLSSRINRKVLGL